MRLIKIILFLFFNTLIWAQDFVPYFCSTKFNYVSVRESASFDAVVKFVYIKKNEPVKVIESFCNWRKIIDAENDTGWVHASCLSAKRYVVINSKNNKPLYYSFDNLKVKAFLKKNLRCKLLLYNSNWCKVSVEGYQGWINKSEVWGLE